MPLDYIILLVVAVIGVGGGLLALREAKKCRSKKHIRLSGNNYQGKEYVIEILPEGELILKQMVVVPADEFWLHEPKIKEALAQADKWMNKNLPTETDLDALEASIHLENDRARQRESDKQ